MDGYEEQLAALRELGAKVYAASVDSREDTEKLAGRLSFPLAYGVGREQADRIGAFWEEDNSFMQPTEFLLEGPDIIASTYSSSPVGRIFPGDAVKLLAMLSKRQGEQN